MIFKIYMAIYISKTPAYIYVYICLTHVVFRSRMLRTPPSSIPVPTGWLPGTRGFPDLSINSVAYRTSWVAKSQYTKHLVLVSSAIIRDYHRHCHASPPVTPGHPRSTLCSPDHPRSPTVAVNWQDMRWSEWTLFDMRWPDMIWYRMMWYDTYE